MNGDRRNAEVHIGDLRYNSLTGRCFLVVDFKSRDVYTEMFVDAFVPENRSSVIYEHRFVKNCLLISRCRDI